MMEDVAITTSNSKLFPNPRAAFRNFRERLNNKEHEGMERETMRNCLYFMGRTEWDKAIVRHFAPNASYYYCPEAIRDDIFNSDLRWSFKYDDTIRIITISNAGGLKGNEIMLRAAWILTNIFGKKMEWKVTMTSKSLLQYEKRTGIRASEVGVVPIGRVKSSQIPETICCAELFVHCAIMDNSPNALCEAQLIGCPIIATNAGGIPQIITDNETGFLYPYAEPYALAFKILELHNNKDILSKVAEKAYTFSHERHNPKDIAVTLLSIYKRIIDINKIQK